MLAIALRYGLDDRHLALLRPLAGTDELAVEQTSYRDAVALVDRLLATGDGAIDRGRVHELAVCDMDAILSGLYRALFGGIAEARCVCPHCGKPFEFELPVGADLPQPDGCEAVPVDRTRFRLPQGTVFRLPEVRDLLVSDAAVGPRLAKRFVVATGGDGEAAVEAAIARLAPACVESVSTQCPSCGTAQSVDFDIAAFLMKSLIRERDFLLREVHIIARAYGWSLTEILALTRPVRHGFVRLAGGATAAARRSAA